ncbi:MAG: carbohydrate ABC transporter permease [Rhodospirillaceae bacterium]|nr:carbohydrate ABC transporter permease [Rhodospirillaceae bacterium]
MAPLRRALAGLTPVRRPATSEAAFLTLRAAVVGFGLIAVLAPLAFLLLTSLKPADEFLTTPPVFIPHGLTLEHYRAVLSPDRDTFRFLLNSLIVAGATTVLSVALGSLAAYALARLHLPFRLATLIAFAFLIVRFYPKVTVALPYFLLMRDLGLLDTLAAVIATHVGLSLPFVVWLMLAFFREFPRELEESARIDGCTVWQRFCLVILPLTGPALMTAALMTVILSWNEFLMASAVAPVHAKTLPVRIAGFITDKGILWGPMSAMSAIIVIPVMLFALFAQRYLVRGLTLGAVKG